MLLPTSIEERNSLAFRKNRQMSLPLMWPFFWVLRCPAYWPIQMRSPTLKRPKAKSMSKESRRSTLPYKKICKVVKFRFYTASDEDVGLITGKAAAISTINSGRPSIALPTTMMSAPLLSFLLFFRCFYATSHDQRYVDGARYSFNHGWWYWFSGSNSLHRGTSFFRPNISPAMAVHTAMSSLLEGMG